MLRRSLVAWVPAVVLAACGSDSAAPPPANAAGAGGTTAIAGAAGNKAIAGAAGATITAGSGGSITAGSGGSITITAGSGGSITAGSGGSITITAGSGGSITAGSGGAGGAGPTDRQTSQIASIAAFVQTIADNTGSPTVVDAAAVIATATATILDGDGSDRTYYAALWTALSSFPEGHQGIYSNDPAGCPVGAMPASSSTAYGVCARLSPDGLVITIASASDNPLMLARGDRVVALDGVTGPSFLDPFVGGPTCGDYIPSPIARRETAATTFFASIHEGATITVRNAAGVDRDVTITAPSSTIYSCQDPFGGNIAFNAQATLRPDGIGVIRLPRFYPIGVDPSTLTTDADFQKLVDDFRTSVLTEFNKVKDAPGIVWDVRGNGGGITEIGLEIVNGMPSAQAMDLTSCVERVVGSQPPTFGTDIVAPYAIVPGGAFAYPGKVAVIIDGLDYSATDYFAYAVHHATSVKLVGSTTSGAFGGSNAPFTIDGPPPLLAAFDPNHCTAIGGGVIEGTGTDPDVPLTYDPTDLANGVDTLVEAAVALVK